MSSTVGDEQTQAVLKKLLADHVGHSNAVTENQLAEALDMNKSTLRSEIERLRDSQDIPIQNFRDGNGYFLPCSEQEFRDQIARWNKKKQEVVRRIETHKEAWERWDESGVDIPEGDCAKCGGEIQGDPWLWYSEELCKECNAKAPALESDFQEWL